MGIVQRHQRAGDRPGAQVAIALIPDQPGFMHILAADVEPEDRDRQVAARSEERQQFMAADDLAATDAVAVVQDDVKGLDLGVGSEEGFGLCGGRSGGGLGHGVSRSSVRISSKAAIRRSIWCFFVTGLTSIMLWNGAIRLPRFNNARCSARSISG